MGLRRKKINAEIRKDISSYWTKEERERVERKIRATIYREIDFFEKQEEQKVQEWAHKMVQGDKNIVAHADRFDIKLSIRKYLRQQIILNLGYAKFFPEEPNETKKDEENKTQA